jgi:hypothetical protein
LGKTPIRLPDLFAVLEKFADDDPLVFNFASDAVRGEKVDRVEHVGFHIRSHLIQGRTIEQGAAVPIVNVLLYKHVAGGSDLSFQLHKLALISIVPSFCCASVLTRAYSAAFVIHGESIPEDRPVVESSAVDIESGEGKSVCMASVFSEGQDIYSTSFSS